MKCTICGQDDCKVIGHYKLYTEDDATHYFNALVRNRDTIDRLTTENCELLISNKDLREYNECVNGTIRVWKLDYAELESKNASLKYEVESLKGLLKELEWRAWEPREISWCCPCCENLKAEGHSLDCKLKQAITEKEAK